MSRPLYHRRLLPGYADHLPHRGYLRCACFAPQYRVRHPRYTRHAQARPAAHRQMVIAPFDRLARASPAAASAGSSPCSGPCSRAAPSQARWDPAHCPGLGTQNGLLFHTGASLTIIAIGLTIRWILQAARCAPRPATASPSPSRVWLFRLLGAPHRPLHNWFGVPDFRAGIEIFFVGGIMMVAGAVWAVMYNADMLLGR